jgi:glycosyltransferase involved in cell wall biosynthesis
VRKETGAAGSTVIHWTTHFYPLMGGLSSHIDAICSNLTSFQHLVVTDQVRGAPRRERFRANAEIIRFGPPDFARMPPHGMGHKVILPIASIADFLRGFRERRFLERQRRKVLHVHDVEWNLVHLDAVARLDVGGRITRAVYSPVDGLPSLLTKHFLFPPGASQNLRRWERKLTLQFPTIVCVDKAIEETVTGWAEEEGVTRDVRFIPNSIDPDLFHPEPLPPFDRLRVGFVARLDEARGESFLREFLSDLPEFIEFHGAIASDSERFERMRREFGSDRIKFDRNVPQERLPEFLAGIHVLINPLTVDYPVTRSALEAMACGRCVIMFGKQPRPPLEHGKTALFTTPRRDDVIRLLRSLHEDPKALEGIGLRARRAVEPEFSHARVLPRLEQLYEELLRNTA